MIAAGSERGGFYAVCYQPILNVTSNPFFMLWDRLRRIIKMATQVFYTIQELREEKSKSVSTK